MHNPEKPSEKESIYRRAEIIDAPLILGLLVKNLAKNLPEDEKKNGLYYEPTEEELIKIINGTGVYLSLIGTELKGYFITMSRELAQTIPFEAELLTKAANMIYDGKTIEEYNYAVLAQICIAKEYRGSMTFHRLHLGTQSMLRDQGYEIGLGEISDKNSKSLAVHSNNTEVGTYIAESGLKWHVVVVELRED